MTEVELLFGNVVAADLNRDVLSLNRQAVILRFSARELFREGKPVDRFSERDGGSLTSPV